jgi:hypothetical protein
LAVLPWHGSLNERRDAVGAHSSALAAEIAEIGVVGGRS